MSASAPVTLPPQSSGAKRQTPGWIWIALSFCVVVAIGFFFVPAFIIRPFTHQAPRPLWLAMALRQRAPAATLLAGLACFAFAYVLWRAVGAWRKTLLVIILLLATFSAVMARVNYFEWMFHPIAGAQFLAVSSSKLDANEMIMSVAFGSDARAYPISQMAYHHVLNDVVGGVPIAVTY